MIDIVEGDLGPVDRGDGTVHERFLPLEQIKIAFAEVAGVDFLRLWF